MFVTLRKDPALNVGNRVSRLFDEVLSGSGLEWPFRDGTLAAWVPVDIIEEAEGIRIVAEVPGVKPEDVAISVENNVLTIRGTKQQVAEERAERVHSYERAYGTFERSFTLPASVDAGNIKATYEHGVLTVTLPKVEKAKPRRIEVQVSAK